MRLAAVPSCLSLRGSAAPNSVELGNTLGGLRLAYWDTQRASREASRRRLAR